MKRRGRPIIAWRVEQGPAVPPPAGQVFFSRGQPVAPAPADAVTFYAEREDREAAVSMWGGIRRRLRGQSRPLPAPSTVEVDRLVAEVERALEREGPV